eukprot:GILI01022817.1.p1 GENE.GILI01022817.1~~GILI01022817.1.p1  ORF type:complete len:362 (-),score=60.53 GILI01022817.1:67-1152(-)
MAKLLAICGLLFTLTTFITSVDAFDKRYPVGRAEMLEAKPDRKNKAPGSYEPWEYDTAMPDYNDPEIDGPQLECTACLTVADIVARRFSKLKKEFRVNMENIKPYHIDAALDELCTSEQFAIGLLLPNVTNHLGERADKQFRSDRMEKEDRILEIAKKKDNEKQAKKKTTKSTKPEGQKKENNKLSAQELKWKEEEKEWRRVGLSEFAIARRTRLRMNFTIWPEYVDEREMQRKTGGIPQDVSVLRNTKILSHWQGFCSEAMARMEDFGLLKVFRGSKSFNLCPMCKRDDPLAQGRSTNPGGVSANPEEATAISDAEIKKRDRERRKKLAAEAEKKAGIVDLGDDDEDAKFIAGKSDEYEL